jgi:hypothetical protein
MPLGDFPAGEGPAGVDPVYKPATPDAVVPAAAIFYDPSIRQYDPTTPVHPVDQIVASRTTAQKNSSSSNPDLGTRLRARFALAPLSQHPTIAYQEMAGVLSDLIAAGDIQLIGVKFVIDPVTKRQTVMPNYRNLRTSGASPSAPFTGAPTLSMP